MAEAVKAEAVAALPGWYLVGEYLSGELGREYPKRDGSKARDYRVKVLVGEAVYAVSYESELAAKAALNGGLLHNGERPLVKLAVRIYPSKGAFVSYRGVGVA